MDANDAKRKAWSAVASLWDDEIEFLQELVRRPSTRGETNLVQRFIAETLRDMGLEAAEPGIDLGQIAGQPGFSPPEWSYEGLINVVGKAPAAAQGGRSLIFNGHVDVVSAEPLGHWSHNPWGGDIVNGRMYGRGAADMKSGVAAMIYALKAVHEAEVKLRGDVLIETVIDEECTGNGTLSCLAQGYRADAAVIPEPTHLSLVTAHPGVLWCRIRVRGLGAHAERASTAVNAAEKMFVLIQALRKLEAEWNRPERRHPAFANMDHPLNFNVGTFHAGDWPSSVPELATVEVRLSYFPGETLEAVKQRIRECVMDASKKDEWLREHPPEVSFFGFHAEPAVYDTGSEIARVVAANNECVTGRPTQARPFTATIDNRFFQLYFGIPTVCYGPTGERLHAPNEWVDLESVRVCTQSLAGVLIDWCGLA